MIERRIKLINKYYGEPQCFLVALLLSHRFMGTIFYNNDHCVTMIGGKYYDKRGVVPIKEVKEGNYLPLQDFGLDIEITLMDALVDKHK